MNVAQETLGLRRGGLSPPLSLLMSAFALPIPPEHLTMLLHRPTERSPTASAVSDPLSAFSLPVLDPLQQTLQHFRDFGVLVDPVPGSMGLDVAKIGAVTRPDLHLVARAERHEDVALELGLRGAAFGNAFGKVGADRFARPPNLIGKGILLDLRKRQADPMHFQRDLVGALEYFEVKDALQWTGSAESRQPMADS